MRELGTWEGCGYPGFSDDPMDAFRNLAHDITVAEDYLSGTGEVLRIASEKEARKSAAAYSEFMVGPLGIQKK